MKAAILFALAVVLRFTVCFGQTPARRVQTFHVKGKVSGPLGDDVVPGTRITFESEHDNKTVVSDSKGAYEADLPVGLYRMTAQYQYLIGRSPHIQQFTRPLFRGSSGMVLVLNVSMFAERLTCDIVVVGREGQSVTPEQQEWSQKNLCGGEDLFPAHSSDGTPLQLCIRYPKRTPSDERYDYAGAQLATNAYTPVLVEYNLFTLTAERVVYDQKVGTIAATGNVIAENGQGETQRATSMTFKIGNGEAVPIP